EFRLRFDPGGGDLPDRRVRQLHLYQGARRADSGSTATTAPANTVSVHTLATAAASRRARAKLYEGFGFYACVAGFVVCCLAPFGPIFRQFHTWGLTNNYLALILPNVAFTLPICIWTLTPFFSELPRELEESARVDGCTRMQAFTRITVPLSAPGVFTAAILLFIQAWNEFLFARTFMSLPNRLTATVAIAQFEGADQAAQYPWG